MRRISVFYIRIICKQTAITFNSDLLYYSAIILYMISWAKLGSAQSGSNNSNLIYNGLNNSLLKWLSHNIIAIGCSFGRTRPLRCQRFSYQHSQHQNHLCVFYIWRSSKLYSLSSILRYKLFTLLINSIMWVSSPWQDFWFSNNSIIITMTNQSLSP